MPTERAIAHRSLVLFVALIVSACGGQPVVNPSGAASTAPTPDSSAAQASNDPLFAGLLADAIAHAGQPVTDLDIDVARERLMTDMGLQASLGSDADRVLGLAAASEEAARSKEPIPPGLGRTTAAAPDGAFVNAMAIVAAVKRPVAPHQEFKEYLAGGVDAIGFDGPNPFHADLGIQRATQADGALSGTSQIHTTIDVMFAGSDVKATFDTDIQNTVTDTATGSTVLTEAVRNTITGEIDACPNATGSVPASLDVAVDEEASTFAGAGGRAASHATGHATRSSKFSGTSDDQATLGTISQTFTENKQFKRTASVDGGPEATKEGAFTVGVSGINDGAATDRGFGATIGDWSGATKTVDESGDVTPDMGHGIDTDAGYDYATIEASYTAAQKVWRDSRCVIVTAPSYIPESAFAFNAKPTHTEEVDKGSTTQFEVRLGHQFGQSVTARISAALDGKNTLSPDVIEKAPGTLTYVAPDDDGQDAHVLLESTSRQGVGKLKLTFHTGGKKLSVSIDGKMTTSGFGVSYVTTMHVPAILLSRTTDPPRVSPDGGTQYLTYSGSGPATAKVLLGIPDCPKPYTETGTFQLRAELEVTKDETLDGKWTVTWVPSTFSFKGGVCVGVPLESFVGAGDAGPVGGFMTVLGPIEMRNGGDTLHVKHTTTLGASKNTIDATVIGKIVSESGP